MTIQASKMRKTPAALLAACSLGLGLWACGGSGRTDSDGQPGMPDNAPRLNTPAATARPGEPAPIGAQPVADTPVAELPSHEGHSPIAEPSPQPVLAEPEPAPAAPSYTREWVVSASGSDSGDGSAAQPFRSIAKAISVAGPGEVVRVLAGNYAGRVVIGEHAKAGSEGAPITLQGEGKPRIVPGTGSGALVQVRRPQWIIDGFELDVQRQPVYAVTFQGDVQGSTLANSELHHGTLGAAVTTYDSATGAVIENNHIYGFVKSSGNQDSHGVVVQPTSREITVRNNDIHDNSGDSVQCLGPEGFSSLPPADGLLIESNHFYANRENAVDIKTCHNVTIRRNKMHGFKPSSTAKGDAVVVHYSARNVLIEDNEVYDSGKGISVGGNHEGPVPSGVVVRRNRVHDITNQGGGEGTAIRLENSDGTVLVNNTVTRVDTALIIGHGTGGPTSNLQVENNLIAESAVAVSLGGQRPGLKMGYNLFPSGAQFKANGQAMGLVAFQQAAGDSTSTEGSAGAAPPAFGPDAVAVDRGTDVGLPFCGGAPDIGAVETGC
ncbi:right-handed parallel beta-helix repeat-containing protein [Archangium lansingense]|uniref:Right-handed parallel beta-helix repeat-containing protein n=1 Tax=Archangium lansingense TaxID=2995310 RepID=A0ABT4A642_9BACT|nr:right-handed parallel beta-helix repeat-containing protein [Archangium lansinium]MCY1077128.1 right-handed parallel beta-helix repeat-containing protein [Archangium lansinium]